MKELTWLVIWIRKHCKHGLGILTLRFVLTLLGNLLSRKQTEQCVQFKKQWAYK